MEHPFKLLRDENLHRYSVMKVSDPKNAVRVAQSILNNRAHYEHVSQGTGIPIPMLGALTMRESSQDFHSYFGNGDPLVRDGRPAKTIHVPSNRGPFANWEEGAMDALHLDGLDRVTDWNDIARDLYEAELFNGFGPRAHGRVSGYVFAGTDQYNGGKYVSDGHWDPDFVDPQLGVAPLIWGMLQIEPGLMPKVMAPVTIPKLPTPVPVGLGGGDVSTFWIQSTLNALGADPQLKVDQSYGRVTTRAVRDYQSKNLDITGQPLEVDGLAGPKTIASMQAKIAWKATQ